MDNDYIVSNQAKCLKCDDVIWSGHRHDFRTCSCGSLSVDGGQAYLKRVGISGEYEDQSIKVPESLVMSIEDALADSEASGRNHLGMALAVLRELRDRGYQVVKVAL